MWQVQKWMYCSNVIIILNFIAHQTRRVYNCLRKNKNDPTMTCELQWCPLNQEHIPRQQNHTFHYNIRNIMNHYLFTDPLTFPAHENFDGKISGKGNILQDDWQKFKPLFVKRGNLQLRRSKEVPWPKEEKSILKVYAINSFLWRHIPIYGDFYQQFLMWIK